MKSRLPLLIVVLLAALSAAPAQENHPAYRIASVEFEIDGKTRPSALEDRLEIQIGREFRDLASLEAYIADRRQVLVNQRVLDEAELIYSVEAASSGLGQVKILVRARDSWNIIMLPYPRYSTNDGLLLSLRFRNYNFLGTMETLYLDLDYVNDENGDQSFGIGTKFSLPLKLGGLDWTLETEQDFSVSLDGVISYVGEQTAKLDLGGDGANWTARIGQNFLWNEDGSEDDDLDHLVLHTLAGLCVSIDLFEVGDLGIVTLTPDLEAGWKYRADGTEISDGRKGPYITASYTVDTGRADWSGNLRKGTVLSFGNSYSYNLYDFDWSITAKLQALHYEAWFRDRVGLNSRITLLGSFLGVDSDIGGYIRGIPDANIDGDYAVFANLDLPIRLFDFKPSLLIKKKWFDFEAHASPFVDAAFVKNGQGSDFEPYLCGGLELFGFLKQARSIYARLSLGINALGYLDTQSLSGNYEFFFGLGHDY